jgi:DNA-binding NarL/FixJ family response regulator
MRERQNKSSQTEQVNDSEFPSIIGSFWLQNHHYYVIHIKDILKTFTKPNLNSSFFATRSSEICQIEIDGQLCAIVEAENFLLDTNSDLTALLTERELQIVKLVAQGKPNKQIAHQLYISEWTVSTHLRRIFAKLNVDSRAAMVYRCASLLSEPC